MRILIVEDESYNYKNLAASLLRVVPEAEIEGPVTDVVTLRKVLQRQGEYDMIFCDIRLDDGLCFDALSEVSVGPPLIFTTAYDEYALQAFRAGGISYLLKPIEPDELKQAVDKARQMKRGEQNISGLLELYGMQRAGSYAQRILVNQFDGMQILPVDRISHIAFEAGRVVAYLTDGTSLPLADKTLDAILSRLDPASFFRANRQHIVRIDAIRRIHTWFRQTENIEMKGYADLRIKVSKEMVPAFHAWIER